MSFSKTKGDVSRKMRLNQYKGLFLMQITNIYPVIQCPK